MVNVSPCLVDLALSISLNAIHSGDFLLCRLRARWLIPKKVFGLVVFVQHYKRIRPRCLLAIYRAKGKMSKGINAHGSCFEVFYFSLALCVSKDVDQARISSKKIF